MIPHPTVFIVDDDPTMRDSLCWLLESMKMSTRAFVSAREFLAAYDPSQPGCLLLDVRMPDMSGLQLQEVMANRGMRLPVIFITGHGDVPMAVRAMKQGAYDFLEKPFKDQVLLECVQRCIALDAQRRSDAEEDRHARAMLRSLTAREREVLHAVVNGRANKQIAADLGISVKTVEAHRGHVMDKLRLRSVAELTTLYVTHRGNGSPVHEGKPLEASGVV